jgi:hypothetical protein
LKVINDDEVKLEEKNIWEGTISRLYRNENYNIKYLKLTD